MTKKELKPIKSLCSFPFDKDSYVCKKCENKDYCKSKEKKK